MTEFESGYFVPGDQQPLEQLEDMLEMLPRNREIVPTAGAPVPCGHAASPTIRLSDPAFPGGGVRSLPETASTLPDPGPRNAYANPGGFHSSIIRRRAASSRSDMRAENFFSTA